MLQRVKANEDIQKDKESWKIIRRQLFYNPLRLLYLREDLYRLVDEQASDDYHVDGSGDAFINWLKVFVETTQYPRHLEVAPAKNPVTNVVQKAANSI